MKSLTSSLIILVATLSTSVIASADSTPVQGASQNITCLTNSGEAKPSINLSMNNGVIYVETGSDQLRCGIVAAESKQFNPIPHCSIIETDKRMEIYPKVVNGVLRETQVITWVGAKATRVKLDHCRIVN